MFQKIIKLQMIFKNVIDCLFVTSFSGNVMNIFAVLWFTADWRPPSPAFRYCIQWLFLSKVLKYWGPNLQMLSSSWWTIFLILFSLKTKTSQQTPTEPESFSTSTFPLKDFPCHPFKRLSYFNPDGWPPRIYARVCFNTPHRCVPA